jgi:hypothetical protein
MILKSGEKLTFFTQTTASFCKNLFRTLVFEENAIFSAENRQKSLKIVIIASTPVGRTKSLKSVTLVVLVF